MSRAGIDVNRIYFASVIGCRIASNHLHLRKVAEVVCGQRCERLIQLDRCNPAAVSDNVRDDCRVISGAAAAMQNVVARLQIERIQPSCMPARQSVG